MNKLFKTASILFVSLGMFLSCDIGLGQTVDTEAPAGQILVPDPQAVTIIRDSFPISGTWTDDGAISSVNVTLRSMDSNEVVFNKDAVIEKTEKTGAGTWKTIVSPEEESIKDNSYNVTVTIQDKAKHTITLVSSIIIDNTAPVIVLSRPSTASTSSIPDSYGQTFTLSGFAADDNNVAAIDVNVYSDINLTNLVHTVSLPNVANSIDREVAQYNAEDPDDDYHKIYFGASSETDVAKTFYCSILSYDNAQRIPVDGSEQSEEDKRGNNTNIYYLNDSVSDLINTYKMTGLYKIKNGTYTKAERSVLDEVLTSLDSAVTTVGMFSLNPANNPKYTMADKYKVNFGEENFKDSSANIINGGSAVITVSPGLDGIAINPDSLKVYAQLCDKYGSVLDETKIYPSSVSKEGSSEYTLVATFSKLDGFKTGKNYLIGLEGQDINGSTVKPNGAGYAFHFAPSDIAPIIKITTPEEATTYKKKGDSLEISGSVEFKDEGTFKILLNNQEVVSASSDNGVSPTNLAEGKLSYLASEEDELLFNFKYIIPASSFNQTESATYSVTLQANTDSKSSSVSKDIKYDVAGPNIIFSVSPVAKKYAVDSEGYAVNESEPDNAENGYLNGTITMNLTLSDDYDKLSTEEDKKPKVTIKQNDKTFSAFSNLTVPSNSSRIVATPDTFNTLNLEEDTVTFLVEAYDRAGNKSEQTYEYTVNQNTDYPVLFPTDTNALSLINLKTYNALINQSETKLLNIFSVDKSPSLDFIYRDDDSGSATADITLSLGDDSYTDSVDFIVQNGKGAFSFPLEQLSSNTGYYKANLLVTDSSEKEKNCEFWISLVPGAPEVLLSEFDDNPYISLSTTASALVPNPKTQLAAKIQINSLSLPFRITKRIEKDSQIVLDYESFADLADSTIQSDNANLTLEDGKYYYSDKITDAELRALSLADGEYKVSYRVYDANGLYNDTGSKTFTVDSSAPVLSGITYPAVNDYPYTPSSFSFEVSAGNQGPAPDTYYFALTEADADEPLRDVENVEDFIFKTATSANKYNLKYASDANFASVFANQGEKKVWYYAQDKAGNRSPVKSQNFFYDEAPPAASLSLSSGSKATTNTRIGFDISASDSLGIKTVKLYENGALLKTYEDEIAGSTAWSAPTGAILPSDYAADTSKTYNYKVTVTDLSGKTYTSPELEVKLDTKKPNITEITTPEDSVLNGDAGTILGKASDEGEGLQYLHYAITDTDTEPASDSTEWKKIPQTVGDWSITQNLGSGSGSSVTDSILYEGAHYLWVYVEDAAENISTTEKIKFFVDQAKPVISSTATLEDNNNNTAEIYSTSVKYLNVDKDAVTYTIKGTITESNGLKDVLALVGSSTSEISGTYARADGENSLYNYTISGIVLPSDDSDIRITIKTTDLANQDSDDLVFTLHNDKTAPVISFIDPSKDITYEGAQSISKADYTFRFNLSDSASGLKNNLQYAVTQKADINDSDITWLNDIAVSGKSSSPSFKPSEKTEQITDWGEKPDLWYLHVKTSDQQGNESSASKSFWVDYSAPSLTVNEISSTGQMVDGMPTQNNGFDLTVSASDTNKLKDVVISSPSFTSQTFQSGSITQSFNKNGGITLADGKHTITVTATDVAGRITSQTVNVYVDRNAPDIINANVVFTKINETGSNDVDIAGTNWYNKHSVQVSVSGISDAASGIYQVAAAVGTIDDNTTWTTLTKADNADSWSGSIYCPDQGANTVTFRITDNAGNEETKTSIVYIDTEAPDSATITSVSIADVPVASLDETILINGSKAVVVKLSASDANNDSENPKCTGIATIVLTQIGNKTGTINGAYNSEESLWTFTIPANNAIFDTGNMQFTLTDKLGNSWNYTSDVSFDFDNQPPTVTIDAITDADTTTNAKDVNNKITITGKASDNNQLYSVQLQYKLSSGEWTDYGEPITADLESWSIEVDTSTFGTGDKLYVDLRAVATDSAQNTGTAAVTTVYVNQDSDRPVITFTSFDLSGMKSDSGLATSQSQTLRGTISDDDGTIQKLEYSTDGSNWNEASLSGVTFAMVLGDNTYNGSSKVRFRITDKAGGEFTNPYIKDKKADYPDITDGAINIIVDSIEPEVIDVGIKPMYESAYSTEFFDTTFGGDNDHNQFWLQLYAYDVNKISSVEYKIDDGSEEVFAEDASAVNGKYTAWNTAETVSVQGLTSGQHTLTITVKDFGGNSKQIVRSIYVDNDAPSLEITSPSESELNHIGSAFVMQGTIENGDIGSSLYYQVTKHGVSADDDSWALVNGTAALSWKLYFDKEEPCEDSSGYTHYLLPKYIVAALNDTVVIENGSAVLASDKTTKFSGIDENGDLEQYDFHFRVKDFLGNPSDTTVPVRIDPQGDIPTITLEYPEVESYAYYNASATAKWIFVENNNGQTIDGDASNGGTEGETYTYVGPSALWSGTIPVSGSASAVNTLTGLYMQVDPTYDPDVGFSATWDTDDLPKKENGASIGSITAKAASLGYEIRTIGNSTKKGIKLGTNLSWSKSINTQNEFELASGDTNYIAIRLFAYDNQNNTSVTDNEIFIIRVNAGAPKIGISEPLQLVQYENNDAGSGSITKRINYTNGMYLKGEWWLTGSVEDENGIYSITINNDNCIPSSTAISSGYRLKYKVGNSTADAYDTLTYTLVAKDGDANTNDDQRHTTTKTLTIKYDNKAPGLVGTTDDYYSISTNVLNSNGFYTVQSAATEESGESGFLRTVVYFKRTVNNYKNIYDAFIKKDATGNALLWDGDNPAVTGGALSDDYLYWKNVGTVSAVNTVAKTVTLSATDVNIHTGGLIRLSGVIYKITAKNGNVLTLDETPATSVNASASVAIGQVIDHVGSETAGTLLGSNDEGYGYYTNSSDDDGDGMIESVSTVGTKTRWSGKINSLNIPDGPIEIHYVVFDKAGNVSHSFVNNAVVKNNVPRLASLKVWSDYNEDGNEDDVESKTYFYSGKTRRIGGNYVKKSTDATETLVVSGTNGKAYMSVKGNVVFYPEIIGGNGDLYYTHKMAASQTALASASASVGGRLTDGTNELSGRDATVDSNYKSEDQDGQVYISGSQFAKITRALEDLGNDSTEASPTWFEYTIWDETPGTTKYVDSLNAKFQIALRVIQTDTEAPKSVVDKFYWKSASDNSLYGNSSANGHIDLEADWEKGSGYGSSSLASTLSDRDPKVSGKITVRGSIYDNVLLDSISLKLPGFSSFSDYVKLASYNAGSWTLEATAATATMETNNWTFSISDEYNNSDGHKANWVFSWDTAYITGVAKADVKVYVQAKAARGETAYLVSSEDASSDNVPYYQMDVVPYITSLTTKLSSLKATNPSIYNRTALGHYPVSVDECEQLTVEGFNLSNAKLIIDEDPKSGNYGVTVSEVPSLNNYNFNNAQGSYGYDLSLIPAQGHEAIYTNFYNRQPNGANNNNLTDDVILDVWEFDPSAAIPVKGHIDQPIMKINPVDGNIGFAFADGALYYSMGGKVSDTLYSYYYWMGAYDSFTSVAFTYDNLGYTYGIGAGGDINDSNPPSMDNLSFMTSRWGICDHSAAASKTDDNNHIRLEKIGQNDGSLIVNKQRTKSPSLATTVQSDKSTTNIYLAYYDAMNDEVRFRYGSTKSTSYGNIGKFINIGGVGASKYSADNVNLVAGGTSKTGKKAGKYVSISVIPDAAHGTKDTVVIVWYDETNRTLWYAYNSSPLSSTTDKNSGSEWKVSRVFPETATYKNAGENCQIAVDSNGHVHIAAYDQNNCDLLYAYTSTPTADNPGFKTCIVDSDGVVGSNLSLDVALNENGQAIPRIGYYAASCVKPKYAWLVSESTDALEGAVNDAFTGNWECTVVPTSSSLIIDNSKQTNLINVGIWKDKDTGVIKDSTTGDKVQNNTFDKYSSTNNGLLYGNGTSNAVLGYVISQDASNDSIEVAQMR